jgi:hypothetical protein
VLEFLKDLMFPITMDHPFFGQIRYLRSVEWWETERHEEGFSGALSLVIEAGPEGPTEEQVRFYQEVLAWYRRGHPELQPILRDLWSNWSEEGGEEPPADLRSHHHLAGLTIPRQPFPIEEAEWSISVQPTYDDHQFTFQMKGWSSWGHTVDG